MFFKDPFSSLKKELNDLYSGSKEGKYKYCALLLLVIFNNKLEEHNLTSNESQVKGIIKEIIEVCEIVENITGRLLSSQLVILRGTFVTYDAGVYRTIHDKLFDFLAVYFGTREELIGILIKYAEPRFVRERFVVTEDIEREEQLIPISDNKLQMYMERVFEDMVPSCDVITNIVENINLKNIKLRSMLHDFMRNLNNQEITALLERASPNFVNVMFVMRGTDIKDMVENRFQKYENIGVILPDDLVQQYIYRWFSDLTKTNSTEADFDDNRLLKSVTFRTTLSSYMRQIKPEKVASIIQTGSEDFLTTMFVMTEHNINYFAEKQCERFGIVIPEGMLQLYIDRWIDDLTKHTIRYRFMDTEENFALRVPTPILLKIGKYAIHDGFIKNTSRLLMNIEFRYAVRIYMRQLTTEKIAKLIQKAEKPFLNTMFVMREEDITDNAKNELEWFGIVIPDDLLQQYTLKCFNSLINSNFMMSYMNMNRVFQNVYGRTSLRTLMKQQTKKEIKLLIQNAGNTFFDTMFVMKEGDIKDNALNRYECFGIVVPFDLIQQYVQRWFDHLTKTNFVCNNRVEIDVAFRYAVRNVMTQLTTEKIANLIQIMEENFIIKMFVLTEDDIRDYAENRYECFGIVIPYDLHQQYMERLFENLTKTYCLERCIVENRPCKSVAFRSVLFNYMRHLNAETIATLITDAKDEFLQKMFVIKEDDIKDDSWNGYECFGIVIPGKLLRKYIERWFKRLTKTNYLEKFIDGNRSLKNVAFRSDLRNYLTQLDTENISSLIWNAKNDFLNKMFVMTKDEIQDDADNLHECLGIVIPGELLQQYIESWFERLTKTDKLAEFIDKNRPLKNIAFRTCLKNHLMELETKKIVRIIWNAENDFFNKMFVMKKDDIQDDTGNRHECFGIVIPVDLLHQYIATWLECLTKIHGLKEFIDTSRPMKNAAFRTALRDNLRQLKIEKITSLIWDAKDDFLQDMFVMAEEDIRENTEERYDWFGIVIPDELLHHYIEKWLKHLTKTSSVKRYIDRNRPLNNVAFRTCLKDYLRQLDNKKIASLIWDGNDDFIQKMFVIAEEDIRDDTDKRSDGFGIVIPDELLHHYIEKWLKHLTKTSLLEISIDENRPLKNVAFRTCLKDYLRQLDNDKIASLIWNANDDFLQKMFVMEEEDIRDDTEKRYDWFGIVIPKELLHHYIKKWLKRLTKTSSVERYIDINRPLNNVAFRNCLKDYLRQLDNEKIASLIWNAKDEFLQNMFVIAEEDIRDNSKKRSDWFVIVIPDELLQHYIKEWLKHLTQTFDVEEYIDRNRPLKNVAFRTCLKDYLRQLDNEKIASLIWNAKDEFLQKMFVMTKEDIRDNTKKRSDWFGIVIPDELLQHYFKKWLKRLTKTSEVEEYIDRNRPLNNVAFRTCLKDYLRQLDNEKIASLISNAKDDFLQKMFVMAEEDIKNDTANKRECVCILIPYDLLQQYMGRWFNCLIKTDRLEKFIDENRPLTNKSFRFALSNYMRQLNAENIASIIRDANTNFINKMFVMTVEDFKDNFENGYECFGIVISDDVLQKYIERWFNDLSGKQQIENFLYENRLLKNVTFCTALQTFTEQINTEQIAYFIQTGSTDFLNRMFVMTKEDIKDNSENRYESFGIVFPDDLFLIQQYIKRWFHSVTEAKSAKEYMGRNRLLLNATFRTALCTNIRQLDTEEIRNFICTGSSDFLNTMFVLSENDIFNDNGEYRFECFGIVIPDDMLQQYMDRWMKCMIKSDSVMDFVRVNRSSMSVIMQTELEPYMNQMNSET